MGETLLGTKAHLFHVWILFVAIVDSSILLNWGSWRVLFTNAAWQIWPNIISSPQHLSVTLPILKILVKISITQCRLILVSLSQLYFLIISSSSVAITAPVATKKTTKIEYTLMLAIMLNKDLSTFTLVCKIFFTTRFTGKKKIYI